MKTITFLSFMMIIGFGFMGNAILNDVQKQRDRTRDFEAVCNMLVAGDYNAHTKTCIIDVGDELQLLRNNIDLRYLENLYYIATRNNVN